MRIFIGIELTESAKDSLSGLQEQLKPHTKSGRFTLKENFHLTLRFLGEVNPEDQPFLEKVLEKIASRHDPFVVWLNQVGEFPRKNQSIVWMGITPSEQLNYLHQDLSEELAQIGFEKENRPYHPHITLGRKVQLKQCLQEIRPSLKWEPVETSVNRVTLFESKQVEGVLRYIPLVAKEL